MVSNLLMEISGQENEQDILIAGDKWNPKGYFENKETVILNNSILLGRYALSNRLLRNPELQANSLIAKLAALSNINYLLLMAFPKLIDVKSKAYKAEIWQHSKRNDGRIIKDPRFSLLLEPWQETKSIQKIIFCFREPYEVALSLKKRSGSPVSVGLQLWKFHNERFLASISSSEGANINFVKYANFFDSTTIEAEMKCLYGFLDLPFNSAQAGQVSKRVITHSLKHHSRAHENYSSEIEKIYAELSERHANQGAK